MLNRLETLKAMGIEVWTLRPGPEAGDMPASSPSPVESRAGKAGETVATRESDSVSRPLPVKPMTDEVPEFRFELLHYETVGICISLAADAGLPRRFCDDIARTMGASIDKARFQMLEWPMLNTSGIDQSLSAARQVLTQKFSIMPRRTVVIGTDVPRFYGPLRSMEPGVPGQAGNQSFLFVPSLVELMGSAAEKRKLMRTLSGWPE